MVDNSSWMTSRSLEVLGGHKLLVAAWGCVETQPARQPRKFRGAAVSAQLFTVLLGRGVNGGPGPWFWRVVLNYGQLWEIRSNHWEWLITGGSIDISVFSQ